MCINDLVSEDGTFHSEHKNDGVEHFGYDKDELCKIIKNNNFEVIEYKIVYTDDRNTSQYPIFQVIAKAIVLNNINIKNIKGHKNEGK